MCVALDDLDSVVRDIRQLDIEPAERWTPEEDYYVHIDVRSVDRKNPVKSSELSKAGRRINRHMIKLGSFDPRHVFNFPDDLEGRRTNLKKMRELAGVGDGYYELWKVRKEFSLADFRDMVAELPENLRVRIVRMMNNEHDINVYDSRRQ